MHFVLKLFRVTLNVFSMAKQQHDAVNFEFSVVHCLLSLACKLGTSLQSLPILVCVLGATSS